jgi:hypothetical protein
VLEVAQQLHPAQQLELFTLLGNLLIGEGALPPAAAAGVKHLMGFANVTGGGGAGGGLS